MTTSLIVSFIWLLSMVGAAAQMSTSQPRPAAWLGATCVFGVVFVLAGWLSPQPNWVGLTIGVIAARRLIAGPSPWFDWPLVGASAALGAALHGASGVSPAMALGLGMAALGGAAFSLRSIPESRTDWSDGALVLVALAGPSVGLAADLLYGWQSATVLNRTALTTAAAIPPWWALAVIVLALAAGAIKEFGRKR